MKKMSMFALLLAAVLVTSYSVSGTYAKYTSTYADTDEARVAKWAFTVNGDNMTTETFDFNLFNTVLEENSEVDAETDIADSTGTIIAPGTHGKFDIELINNSEVNAEYTITYTVNKTDSTIPVLFSDGSVDGEGNQIWVADIAELSTATAGIEMNNNGSEATHTVFWKWAFEGDNAADTQLGLDANDTITVSATIVVTQAN